MHFCDVVNHAGMEILSDKTFSGSLTLLEGPHIHAPLSLMKSASRTWVECFPGSVFGTLSRASKHVLMSPPGKSMQHSQTL